MADVAKVITLIGSSQLAVSAAQVTLDALTCVMLVHIALVMGAQPTRRCRRCRA